MTDRQLSEIRTVFDKYLVDFRVGTDNFHPFLELKLTHSEHVADEARSLSSDLRWSEQERNDAEAIGLLHDVGRFRQFTDYHTFSDADSVDHGELGWHIVREKNFLKHIPHEERWPILD